MPERGPGAGGGPPDLPDAAPEAVQALLDGIWGFAGNLGSAFGSFVSDLAGSIGPQFIASTVDGVGVIG